MKSIACT